MMIARDEMPESSEIELLLPWHAAGTLNPRDAERVEAALARNDELRRRYHLVREELAETIHLNETLGAPSARAMERVMARIEAESARPAARVSFGLTSWFAGFMSRLSPPVLAWAAAAAGLVILLQAGLLVGTYLERGQQASYQTAAVTPASPSAGSYALIGFVPQASTADVSRFLEAHDIVIVDGPRAGGLFKVKIGPANMAKSTLNERIKQLQDEKTVIRFAAVAD